MDNGKRYIHGHEYYGQCADKYYLIGVLYFERLLRIYDKTCDQIKILKVRENNTIRINNTTLSIYNLIG